MIYDSKPIQPLTKPPETTSDILLQTSFTQRGGGVFEVVLPKKATVKLEGLTTLELSYLYRKHESQSLNLDRIKQVKMYWQHGYSAYQISGFLRGKKGCGQRQIEKDLAALSEANKK